MNKYHHHPLPPRNIPLYPATGEVETEWTGSSLLLVDEKGYFRWEEDGNNSARNPDEKEVDITWIEHYTRGGYAWSDEYGQLSGYIPTRTDKVIKAVETQFGIRPITLDTREGLSWYCPHNIDGLSAIAIVVQDGLSISQVPMPTTRDRTDSTYQPALSTDPDYIIYY